MHRTIIAALVAASFLLSSPAWAQASGSETYRQLNLFGDVFERIRAEYVEEVSDQDLIEAAIRGMLASLDPHSGYMSPKSAKAMKIQTKGEFGGLGIEVTMEGGFVKVIAPIDGTPAASAGLKPGDLITHLDGDTVQELTLSEAVERMRGKVDTDIRLTILRKKRDPFDVTITRAIIKIRSVRFRAEGDIGYIRVTAFNEQTESGVIKAMAALEKELGDKIVGLVVDLRNNPGGLLNQAIKVSDAFLDKGEIVSTRGRENENTQRFNAQPGDLAEGLPLVVLINGGSASASEIVAGALRDHGRAIILGTRSFGKGSVQTIMPLADDGAIRLTTARYYTPSGVSIQAKGIEPDILVEQVRLEPLDNGKRRRERDLRGALDTDKTDAPDEATEDEAKADAPEDYQLSRALDLLHGIRLYSSRLPN
ncbi:MAG: S41 family peptidase [Alphaproteobacteria bacterium]